MDASQSARQIIQQYKFGLADLLRSKISELSQKHCYGCEVDHPSQTNHTCLMLSEMEHFFSYRDEAYALCKKDILETFNRTLLCGLCSKDVGAQLSFLKMLTHGELALPDTYIFDMVERMIRLEDRFTA